MRKNAPVVRHRVFGGGPGEAADPGCAGWLRVDAVSLCPQFAPCFGIQTGEEGGFGRCCGGGTLGWGNTWTNIHTHSNLQDNFKSCQTKEVNQSKTIHAMTILFKGIAIELQY